ncbi:MAG TPA: GDSL-type esterase/lipase family protein [Chthoniobacteraceae bacterium]|nr:GDSL-type esterase/lipase family protein [Chthoniobacteraceae bacterium]
MTQRLVCFGDSITAGKSFPDTQRWTSLLQCDLDTLWPGRYAVYQRGIGGNTTYDGLMRFATDVAPFLPAVVLIEFGFNDASVPVPLQINRCVLPAFRLHLAEIVRLVRAGGGEPILIANHPIHERAVPNQGGGCRYIDNFAPYQPAIRECAATCGVPLIDLEKQMRAGGVDLGELLADDGLHLALTGNRIYADFLFTALQPILESLDAKK